AARGLEVCAAGQKAQRLMGPGAHAGIPPRPLVPARIVVAHQAPGPVRLRPGCRLGQGPIRHLEPDAQPDREGHRRRRARGGGGTAGSMTDRIPFRVHAMLATLVREPFHRPGWAYEEKYDGIRILAYKEGSRVRLISRNAKDRTAAYGDVADAVRALPPRTLLLDGEVVALDRRGISRFQLLQQGHGRPAYAVFDCLYENGRDLRREPLAARRRALERTVTGTASLRLARRLAGNGLAAYRLAKRR